MQDRRKVLITGASGYIAGRMLPEFRERYELVLLDVKTTNRQGEEVEGIRLTELTDPDRDAYRSHFEGADAVVHCAFKVAVSRTSLPTFRWHITSIKPVWKPMFDALSSVVPITPPTITNGLIWTDKWDVVTPEMRPLSDNFYGWAKEAYETSRICLCYWAC